MYSSWKISNYTQWQAVPIQECREKFVSLQQKANERIRVSPIYFQQKLPGTFRDIYVREGVYNRLCTALDTLPNEYYLIVWDGWRSPETQKALFQRFYQKLFTENPHLSKDVLTKKTATYVSIPSTDPHAPSPHATGGSIDLTLASKKIGPLFMGTAFDDFSERAKTNYYTHKGIACAENDHRKRLYEAMITAGFTNYAEEWWHYDYGNQFWASLQPNPKAIYGGVERLRLQIQKDDKNPPSPFEPF